MVVEARKANRTAVIIPTLSEAAKEANAFRMNLKYIRQKFGLSEAQMALTMGVDQSTIHRWESGDREPDNYNFMAVKLWAKELKEREHSASY